ncbi:MAG: glycosyltransferase family 9 protein [Ignavibacteriae bacterium]|nr:glycosyltransferase family 9 protein [Ignavibacteriota bacterium]
MNIDRSRIRKILIIKLRAIGDVVLSTVVIRNLRLAFPDAQIDFLTEKPSRDIIEGNPDINNVLVFDGKKQSGLGLIWNVRSRKYDLVIDLFGNPRSALVTYFSGAHYRVGYRFGWREKCYNIVVEPRGGEVHNTEFNLDAVRALGFAVTDFSPADSGQKLRMTITENDEIFAFRYFLESGLNDSFVVALNAAGGWYTKRWAIPKYAELADMLVEQHQAKILLLWGPGERDDAERLATLMTNKAILIPATTLKQLAAILQRCSMMVTNDSGPMHIAAAMGTSTVAIFGPTNPMLQGPFGNQSEIVRNERLGCLGCNFTKCPIGNPCMEELSVEEVFLASQRLISSVKTQNPKLEPTI